ncbi:Cys/Met metabolism PLP-dependent enzyme-domain-containing protein [Kalaharituber pfeilii]|nr:Cys/Met metabolism PLP-dependent enzyme-domain-containing protein [Kalaharituber pfeilii]
MAAPPAARPPTAHQGVLARAFRNIDLEGHDFPPSPTPSSPRSGKKYALATELVYTEHGDQYNSSSMPIYQTATFKQTSADGSGAEFDYTRSGNPTRSHLERHLSKITSSARCLVVSSGMAALDVITRLLQPGDEVITGDDLYGGTNRLLKYLSTTGGIIVHHVDTARPDISLPPVLSAKTRMVLLESPTNPLIKICDIPLVSRLVHAANPGAIVVVDNTMLSPYLQSPLSIGADIVYESGTKYLSGHHDLMAGVIYTNSLPLADKLYFTINASGCALSPFDSWLLLRGIKTLSVRIEKQQSSAQRIAEFLESTCGFKVRYPGLQSHPQYNLHNRLARGPGAVLSFETGDVKLSERVVENTRLWAISVSFGCVNSLISMPCMMSHASINAKTRKERDFPEDLIRLCVGIEDVDDLIDDLQIALVKAGAVKVTVDGICPKSVNEEVEGEEDGEDAPSEESPTEYPETVTPVAA